MIPDQHLFDQQAARTSQRRARVRRGPHADHVAPRHRRGQRVRQHALHLGPGLPGRGAAVAGAGQPQERAGARFPTFLQRLLQHDTRGGEAAGGGGGDALLLAIRRVARPGQTEDEGRV